MFPCHCFFFAVKTNTLCQNTYFHYSMPTHMSYTTLPYHDQPISYKTEVLVVLLTASSSKFATSTCTKKYMFTFFVIDGPLGDRCVGCWERRPTFMHMWSKHNQMTAQHTARLTLWTLLAHNRPSLQHHYLLVFTFYLKTPSVVWVSTVKWLGDSEQ
jgi:hypothetical protein